MYMPAPANFQEKVHMETLNQFYRINLGRKYLRLSTYQSFNVKLRKSRLKFLVKRSRIQGYKIGNYLLRVRLINTISLVNNNYLIFPRYFHIKNVFAI